MLESVKSIVVWLFYLCLCFVAWQMYYFGQVGKLLIILLSLCVSAFVLITNWRLVYRIEVVALITALLIGTTQAARHISLAAFLVDIIPFLMLTSASLLLLFLRDRQVELSPPSLPMLIGLLALLVASILVSFWLDSDSLFYLGNRLSGPLGPAVLAIYLIALLLPLLVKFVERKSVYLVGLILMIVAGIFATRARMPLGAFLVGAGIVGLYVGRHIPMRIFIPIVLLCVAFASYVIFQRMFWDVARNGYTVLDLSGREKIWAGLLDNYSTHKWFGHGFGNAWQFLSNYEVVTAKQPHNDYLRVLNNQGAIGLFLTMFALFAMFGKLVFGFFVSKNPSAKPMYVIAISLWVSFFALALTDNVLIYPLYVGLMLWYSVSALTSRSEAKYE